ncbi:MAG: hypothetical protein P1V51_05520 [Deltaproteobacteria bacterium]|nr:hypothetical protein [Deltaproteobacteria bacterium]
MEVCGDGVLSCVEECDDGNTLAGDGCSATCTLCDPACAAGETCFGSVCARGCLPWGPAADSGCAEGLRCFPAFQPNQSNYCLPAGTLAEGDPCGTGSEDCGAGLICIMVNAVDAVCRTLCASGSGPGDPGACVAGEGCTPLGLSDGTRSSYGICEPSCSFHAPEAACSDPGQLCQPGEIYLSPFDPCLPTPQAILAPHDGCSAAGLSEGESCGAGAYCTTLPAATSVTCEFVCMTSQGALGTTSHPDCPAPTDTCTDLFASTLFGLCVP